MGEITLQWLTYEGCNVVIVIGMSLRDQPISTRLYVESRIR